MTHDYAGDQTAPPTAADRPLDLLTLRQLFTPLIRYRTVAMIAFGAVLGISVLMVALMRPDYHATMKVMVKRERLDPIMTSSANEAAPERLDVTEDEMNSEVELLKSRDLLQRVAHAAHIVRDSRGQIVSDTAANPELTLAVSRAIAELQRNLTVTAIRKSTLIELRYRSADPEQAAEVLKQLARLYVEVHLELRRPPGAYAFFQDQAHTFSTKLADAEARLAEFARSRQVVAPGTERDSSLQVLADFEATLQRTRTQIAESNERLAALRRQITSTPSRQTTQVHTATDAERIRDLKARLLDLERKQADMRRLFSPTYPPLEQLTDQIAQVQRALADADATPVSAETTDQNPTYQWLRDELARGTTERDGLAARERAIAQSVALYRGKAQRLDDARVQEEMLVRDLRSAQQSYELYERKKEEARVSDALDQTRVANVTVVEQPAVPALPSNARRLVALLLGFAAALAVAIAVATVSHFRNPFFRGPHEIESFLGIPTLATLSSAGR